ncbi:MAG: family 43 glycosylhydrolase, partial [Candidatus Cryptobacteroides sp.]
DGIERDSRGPDFDPGNGAVEAPFIFRHGGYYYLFVSYDLCCRGAKSTYNVVVGRSEKVTGPYIDKDGVSLMDGGGTVVAKGNNHYAGVGHCAVVNFHGKDYMFMHGYDSEYEYRSKLLVLDITWTPDGWPVVNLK